MAPIDELSRAAAAFAVLVDERGEPHYGIIQQVNGKLYRIEAKELTANVDPAQLTS